MPRTYRVAERRAQLELELDLAGVALPPNYDAGDDYDEEHLDGPPVWLAGPAPAPALELDKAGTFRIVSNDVVVRGGMEELEAHRELHTFEQAVREVRCGW